MTRVNADRIVLVHGFTQTASSWRPTVARLTASLGPGVDIVALDAPGHGDHGDVRADLPTGAAMLAAEGGRATYVGYSMGGRLCLHLALAFPATRRSAGADRDNCRDRGRSGTGSPWRHRRRRVGRRDRTHRSRHLRRSLVGAAAVRRPRPLGRRHPDPSHGTPRPDSRRACVSPAPAPRRRCGRGSASSRCRSSSSPASYATPSSPRSVAGWPNRSPMHHSRAIESAGHAVHLERPAQTCTAIVTWLRARQPPTASPTRTTCRRPAAPDRSLRARRSTPGRSHGRPPLGPARRRPESPAP